MTPVPCMHIYAYYNWRWEQHHCIAWNLLRKGYYQWATGRVSDLGTNNLFSILAGEKL